MHGFSLIELLSAIALSVLLMLMLGKLVIYVKNAQQLQEAWLKLSREAYYLSLYLYPRLVSVGEGRCDYSDSKFKHVSAYNSAHLPSFITEQAHIQGDVFVITRCEKKGGDSQFVQRAYYVAATKRHDARGSIIHALYEKRAGAQRIELEEGINNLYITLSVLEKTNKLIDLPISSLNEFSKVVGINLQFTLASLPSSSYLIVKPWNIYVYLRGV